MKIKKILNNNAVIAENDEHEEVIVMGKGLAFKAKTGQDVDQTKVDKTFVLGKDVKDSHFARLLSEINLDEFEFTDSLINLAKTELGKSLSNTLYVTLVDHINTAKERAENGIYLTNNMLWEIKRLYPDEFKVGQEMIRQMNVRFGSKFDDNEAATLAIHLINAQTDLGIGNVVRMTKLVNEIMNIVRFDHGVVFDQDSLAWYRFITHLQYFASRLFSGKEYPDESDGMLELVVQKYPEFYRTTEKIRDFLHRTYGYSMTNEEAMYLTIHIAKVVRASRH